MDAADAAGNRSGQATLSADTSDCPTGPDVDAPTTPTGFAKTSSTQTAISVSWSASTDNTAVTSYRTYREDATAGNPTGTSYTFTGLTCGTSYSLAVDAADAAGNRSAKATITASTNACPDTTAPTAPTGLAPRRDDADDHLGLLDGGDRQRRRDRLRHVPQRSASRQPDGHLLHLHRPRVRDELHALRRRRGRRGEPLGADVDHGRDGDLSAPRHAGADRRRATSARPASRPRASRSPGTRPPTTPRVTGYGVYRNGNLIASPTGLTTTVSGLACDTSYTFAVDAVDAAGNRSPQASRLRVDEHLPASGDGRPLRRDERVVHEQLHRRPLRAPRSTAPTRSRSPGDTVQIAARHLLRPDDQRGAEGRRRRAGRVRARRRRDGDAFRASGSNQGGAIEFRDFTVTGDTYNGCNCASSGQSGAVVREITYRRIKMQQFFIRGADKISYIDGEVGPNDSERRHELDHRAVPVRTTRPRTSSSTGCGSTTSRSTTPARTSTASGSDNVDGVTIRNSRIWNCAHFSIIFGNDPSSEYTVGT